MTSTLAHHSPDSSLLNSAYLLHIKSGAFQLMLVRTCHLLPLLFMAVFRKSASEKASLSHISKNLFSEATVPVLQ